MVAPQGTTTIMPQILVSLNALMVIMKTVVVFVSLAAEDALFVMDIL